MNIPADAAIDALWRQGVLVWKLRDHQVDVYEHMMDPRFTQVLDEVHRQFGKSFNGGVVATETALRKRHATISVVAPTQKMGRTILVPAMEKILEDCPEDLRPTFSTMDNVYTFPSTKSVLRIDGADGGNLENLRGRAHDLVIIDEAGFIARLKELIRDVIIPSFLTTNGRLVCITTPPKTAGHYVAEMRQRLIAEGKGAYKRYRLSDNPTITPEVRERWATEVGGADSPAFRREYECEPLTDAEAAVVPEWNEAAGAIVRPVPPPDPYVSRVVGMDLGWGDPTGVVYGYWNFTEAKLYIQAEDLKGKPRIEEIATMVRTTERRLWPESSVYTRISDVDPMVLAELSSVHGLHFRPVGKPLKEQMVNELRTWVRGRRLVIDPSCSNLIAQLEAAIWTDSRRTFEHTPAFGHFDLVDALIYLIHGLPRSHNPYPDAVAGLDPHTHFINTPALPGKGKELRDLFKPRSAAWRL